MITRRENREPLRSQARLENITISLGLLCNQGCQHCWVSAGAPGSDELTDQEIKSVLTQARDLGAGHVKLTGGEPLMRDGLTDLVAYAYGLGFRISIETNGTLLKPAVITNFGRFFDRLHFYVSLDGAVPSTHDSFRGQRGAFQRTVSNLSHLRDADGYFSIHTVARRDNAEEIPQIFALARRLGASQLKLILSIHELGRGASAQAEAIRSDEVFALLDRLPAQRLWDYSWSPQRSRDTVLMTTLPPAFQPSREAATCGWSRSYLAILGNGDVALCHGLYDVEEAKAGNIRLQALEELWLRSSLFAETRSWQAGDLSGVCGNCAVADTCRGLCRANAIARYGDLRAPYPLCQTMYDHGAFPSSMLVDPDRDAHYVSARPPKQPEGGSESPPRRLLPVLPLGPS